MKITKYKGYDDYTNESVEKPYADYMAKKVKGQINSKRVKSKTQAASTQKVLNMNEDELIAYRTRPMPNKDKWKADTDAIGIMLDRRKNDEFIQQTIEANELLKKRGKNHIGDAVSYNNASSASRENKKKAIEHFICHPPAHLTELEEEKQKKLESIQSVKLGLHPIEKPWVEVSLFEAFKAFITGKPVKRIYDEEK